MQHRKTKVCKKCLKRKRQSEFLSHQARGNWCRDCYTGYFKEFNRKRYSSPAARAKELARGKEKYSRVVRVQRMERKKQLLRMMGGRCCLCGYSKSAAALDFDHIGGETHRGNPNQHKRRTVSHLLAMNSVSAWRLAVEEAKKCQILCANCHREKTFPGHELHENQPTTHNGPA